MLKKTVPNKLTLQPKRVALIAGALIFILWLGSMAWSVSYLGVDIEQLSGVKILLISGQLILFALAVVLAPFYWVRAALNLLLMAKERRSDLSKDAFRHIRWNPFNIVAYPDLLTQQGLKYRRKLFESVAWFFFLTMAVFAWEFIFEPFST